MLSYYLHHLDPFIFHVTENIGPRWYGMAYVMAFVCGYALLRFLAKKGYADLAPEKVGDFITGCALLGVIVGGRLGYVFFYKPEMLRDPISIFRVWEGGMASHGGMLGLLLFTYYYARRHKLSFRNLADNLVVTAPIGLFFGRCANFINGELYGRAAHVAFAVQFPKELLDSPEETEKAVSVLSKIDPSLISAEAIVGAAHDKPAVRWALRSILIPRHPSQLYEAFLEGVVLFAILWFVRTRLRQPNGVLSGLFLICYAVFRIIVEYFREPDAGLIWRFTRGQFLSFFLIALGAAFIVAAKRYPTYPEKIPH